MRRLLLVLLLLGCGEAPVGSVEEPVLVSEHYEGVAAFAVQSERFPCREMLGELVNLPAPGIAFPYHTFGTSEVCLRAFVEQFKDRPHLLYVHATNETCRKTDSCAEGDLFLGVSSRELSRRIEAYEPGAISTFRERFGDIRETMASVSSQNTRVVVSTGLEDEYSSKAAEIVFLLAHEQFAEVAENPEVRRVVYSSILEKHRGQDVGAGDVANEDGACRSDSQSREFLRRNKRSLATFLWRPEWQGRKCKDGKIPSAKVPPRERSFVFSDVSGLFD